MTQASNPPKNTPPGHGHGPVCTLYAVCRGLYVRYSLRTPPPCGMGGVF